MSHYHFHKEIKNLLFLNQNTSNSCTWVLLLWLLMQQRRVPERNTHINHVKDNQHEKPHVKTLEPSPPTPWAVMFKSRAFLALLLTAGCESWIFTNLLTWLPTYFQERFPASHSQAWLFNVLPWVANFLFANLAGGSPTFYFLTTQLGRQLFIC